MLITRKAAYGLIAVKHFAERKHAGAISSSELARVYGLPRETVAKVLQHLAEAGLLTAYHGLRGGYVLALEPHQISVLDVIRATECLAGGRDPSSDASQFTMLDHIVKAVLERMRIADIVEYNQDAGPKRIRGLIGDANTRRL